MTEQATQESPKKVSRVEELASELMASEAIASRISEATRLSNPLEVSQAIVAIHKEVMDKAKETAKAEAEKEDSERKAQQARLDTFKANAKEVMGTAWKGIARSFTPLTAAKSFTFRVERDSEGHLTEPTILLGEPKRRSSGGTGTGGGRSNPLTVDGTEYPSAAAARDALLPEKKGTPMNRASIISALTTAKHTVSE